MKLNISGKITQYFINSQLTVLLMAATALLGLFALIYTPREENPQIVVPAANVMVMMPGSSAKEVEELVSKRLESILWEIPGVEDVYSVSMNSMSVVTVKFFVGQDKERVHGKALRQDHVPYGLCAGRSIPAAGEAH